MIHPTEYLIVALLKKEIAVIANDNRLLSDMFSAFRCVPDISELVGDIFYTQLIDLISNQGKDRLVVKLSHLAQPSENFGLYVSGNRSFEHTFLGDYGTDQFTDLPSTPVGKIRLFNRKGNNIDFTIDGKMPCWLKPGMQLASGCKTAVIQRIYPLANKTCIEFVDPIDIPTGEYLFFTNKSTEAVTKGVTTDSTSVSLTLACVGDFEVHYGLQMLVNYCLRRIWPTMDAYGFQNVRVSQSEAQEIEFGGSGGFLTTFSLQGKTTSTWIQNFQTRTEGDVSVEILSQSCKIN